MRAVCLQYELIWLFVREFAFVCTFFIAQILIFKMASGGQAGFLSRTRLIGLIYKGILCKGGESISLFLRLGDKIAEYIGIGFGNRVEQINRAAVQPIELLL